jgi:predicted GNAT family acetyltransferase
MASTTRAASTTGSVDLTSKSLGWVTATDNGQLTGFVPVVWDGADHAFLLDTVVARTHRRQGIGIELVRRATLEVRNAGIICPTRRCSSGLERMRPRDCGCPPEQRPCPRRAPRTRWSRCVGATRERAGDQGRGQHLHDGVDHRREGDLFGQAGGEHDDRGDAELLLGDGEQHR